MRACFIVAIVAACGGPSGTGQDSGTAGLEEISPAEGFMFRSSSLVVPAHTDLLSCIFLESPDELTWTGRLVVDIGETAVPVQRVTIYRVGTPLDLTGNPGEVIESVDGFGPCADVQNVLTWDLVTSMAREVDGSRSDWTLAEPAAFRFMAREKLMIQVHSVNVTDEDLAAQVGVNFYHSLAAAPSPVEILFASIRGAINICPAVPEPITIAGSCDFEQQLHIVAARGEYYSRATNLRAYAGWTGTPPVSEDMVFYDKSAAWRFPLLEKGLALTPEPDRGIYWRCLYSWSASPTCADCCYAYHTDPAQGERCDLYVYYWRDDATAPPPAPCIF